LKQIRDRQIPPQTAPRQIPPSSRTASGKKTTPVHTDESALEIDWPALYRNPKSLLPELKPEDKGSYFIMRCPVCGHREAYMYNDNPGHIRCNRQNNCGNTIAVFDYVHQREHHENRWETVVYLHEQAGLKPPILREKHLKRLSRRL